MNRFAPSCLLAALLLSTAAGVSAQDSSDETARHFFETGRTYFDRAQYTEAAEAFAEAYRLSGRPALLINQARALEAAGEVEGAIAALEQAQGELEEGSDVHASIEPKLRRLRAEQERRAAATEEERQAEDARRAEEARRAAEAARLADEEARRRAEEEAGPGTLFWVGVGVGGFGVASLITSLATGLAAHGIYSDLETACPGDVCPPEREGDIDRGRALAAASTALLFIGAVSAAVGVTLVVLDLNAGGEEDDPEGPTVALRLGAGTLRLDGRF